MSSKILIIDDSDLIRFTTSLLLRQLGYESAQADSGKSGVAMASTCQPDAILLDIMMPEMDGWEVLNILSSNPDTAEIPIVIFTALEEQLFPPQAELPCVKAILQKPFHLDELTQALQQALPLG